MQPSQNLEHPPIERSHGRTPGRNIPGFACAGLQWSTFCCHPHIGRVRPGTWVSLAPRADGLVTRPSTTMVRFRNRGLRRRSGTSASTCRPARSGMRTDGRGTPARGERPAGMRHHPARVHSTHRCGSISASCRPTQMHRVSADASVLRARSRPKISELRSVVRERPSSSPPSYRSRFTRDRAFGPSKTRAISLSVLTCLSGHARVGYPLSPGTGRSPTT